MQIQKGIQIVRIMINIVLNVMIILCFSEPTFGFDLKLREYFHSQVEKSDEFINNANKKVNQSLQRPTELITSLTRGGFSLFEKRTGLSDENKLYKVAKNATLRKTGFKLGVAEGMKDFTMGTASLLVQLNTLPARTINLAYNVNEKPQEYKKKLVSGTKTLVGVLAQPRVLFNSIHQSWQNTVAEAKKDPLQMGKLQGEIAAFGGTLLLGGGQAKTATKAGGLLKSATKSSTLAQKASMPSLSLPTLNFGFLSATPITSGGGVSKAVSTTARELSTVSAKKIKLTPPAKSAGSSGTYPLSFANLEKQWGTSSLTLPGSTVKQMKSWVENSYNKWAEKLSADDLRLLNTYTDNSYHYNNLLRGVVTRELTPDESLKINKLSKILCSVPLNEEIVLFRGTSKTFLGELAGLPPEKLVGKVLSDKGFLSTSILPNEALDFSKGVFLVIKAPKGTKGAYLGEYSSIAGEQEFLLDKGQKMLIKKAFQDKKGLTLFADLI